jgi:hypothetical protein
MLDCQVGAGTLDHVFPVPSDDDEPPVEVRELADRANEELIEALAVIGVHVTDRLVMVPTEEGADGTPTANPANARAVMQGFVGEIAFSDRVLRPQQHDDGEVLAEIESATAAAEYEAIRTRLLKDPDG